ncbi:MULTISPECIES: peroxidase family protein [unclassified Coleofasciculus]|uniref:peroxidase family protein n=1 Tax=unclassified Coleofasciculus TaxID=2692782 RepID=UPI00187E6116|nr:MULTISPECIES: peroxidase family protein [unclassified Coleofasciculus]MBE9128936.1 PEP-CTERM sorting domain-containing protein [Coleofasciculus sp. LEGE 07081]MBE9151682.1 PEP-CTERM sorting domain-containing protein [Coleofasciculus sp. LEGE 07092]
MLTAKTRHTILSVTSFATLGFALSLPAEAIEFRSFDGSGNNITNPSYGAAETELIRLLEPDYGDGISSPAGANRPNPRAISNAISRQSSSVFNPINASDWLWQWGQFIDHDIDLTEPLTGGQFAPIIVPDNDPVFAPGSIIPFRRNEAAPGTGTSIDNPRQQVNALTSYIDASQVYGSDSVRANSLRTLEGGKLKTSDGNLLPFNIGGLPNANPPRIPGAPSLPDDQLFVAGDVRANEQIGLTAVHTLFVREHNRLADEIAAEPTTPQKAAEAGLTVDEYIYQTARRIVGAQIQVITYNEFLPLLLGDSAFGDYTGYNANVDAGMSNEFANAAYRFGHSLLSPELQRINNDGSSPGAIALRDSFFNPQVIVDEGIDSLLLGLASQKAQNVDALLVEDVRSFLFAAGGGGLDLAAVNIQRGRDHGLPSYNAARTALGLGVYNSFEEITSDAEIAQQFRFIYGVDEFGNDNINDVDLWIGGIAEDHVNGGLVGELFYTIMADQFGRSRDGDRFFYLNDEYLLSLKPEIGSTTLSEIIRRNSNITSIQDNVFIVAKDVPEPSVVLALFTVGVLGAGLRRLRR